MERRHRTKKTRITLSSESLVWFLASSPRWTYARVSGFTGNTYTIKFSEDTGAPVQIFVRAVDQGGGGFGPASPNCHHGEELGRHRYQPSYCECRNRTFCRSQSAPNDGDCQDVELRTPSDVYCKRRQIGRFKQSPARKSGKTSASALGSVSSSQKTAAYGTCAL